MSQYKETDEQVRKILAAGETEENVKIKLRESGYNEEDISSILFGAKSAPAEIVKPISGISSIPPIPSTSAPASTPAPSAPAPESPTVPAPVPESPPTPIPPPAAPQPTPTITSQNVPPTFANSTPPVAEPKKSRLFLKVIITIIILLSIGAGTAFAYYKIDPFFLKDEKMILGQSIENTYEAIVSKDFSGKNIHEMKLKTPYTPELILNIPVMFQIDYIEGKDAVNGHVIVGDIDVGSIFTSMMDSSEIDESLIGNEILNFELKLVDGKIFLRLNKFPDFALKMFPILGDYVNKWIYSDLESATSIAQVDAEDLKLTQEEIDYIKERLRKAFIFDANPEITSEKIDGKMEITYTVLNKNMYDSMVLAIKDISNKLGHPIPEDEFDASLTEEVEGSSSIVFTVNKNLLIEKINTSFAGASDNEFSIDTKIELNLDFVSTVDVVAPESNLSFEEIMATFSSPSLATSSADSSLYEAEGWE